jgi:hypothetical protein
VNKIAVVLLLCLFLFTWPSGITAQSPSPSTTDKVQRIEKLGVLMSDRMQQVINQMENLHGRIQAISEKVPLTKSDAANLTTWMTTTQTNLDSAQTAVAKFKIDLHTLTTSNDYGRLIPELVLETKLVKDSLIGAHTALSEVVRRLVELSPTPAPTGKSNLAK